MNNYFNSDSFINELRPLKDILKRQSINQNVSLIEYVVGKAIQYFIMFDNGDRSIMNEVSSFTGKITDFISKALQALLYRLQLVRLVTLDLQRLENWQIAIMMWLKKEKTSIGQN